MTPSEAPQAAEAPLKCGEKGGRDHLGRFVAGHGMPGPGRPRGVDLRAAAESAVAATGRDLADELGAVVLALLDRAKSGDVHAARTLFDRLAVDAKVLDGRPTLETLVLNSYDGEIAFVVRSGVPCRDDDDEHDERPQVATAPLPPAPPPPTPPQPVPDAYRDEGRDLRSDAALELLARCGDASALEALAARQAIRSTDGLPPSRRDSGPLHVATGASDPYLILRRTP